MRLPRETRTEGIRVIALLVAFGFVFLAGLLLGQASMMKRGGQ